MTKVFILSNGERVRENKTHVPISRQMTRVVPAVTEIDAVSGNERVVTQAQEVTEPQEFNTSYAALNGWDEPQLNLFGITTVEEGVRPDERYYDIAEGPVVNGVVTYTSTPKPLAPIKEAALTQVRSHTQSLIEQQSPLAKQIGTLDRQVELLTKLVGQTSLTPDELAEFQNLQRARVWIKAARAQLKSQEDQIAAATTIEQVLAIIPA